VEPPARVNPQNIISDSLQTTTQNIFILCCITSINIHLNKLTFTYDRTM